MAKQNLLLVDADLRSLRVLEVSLRKAGYNVASIGSAKDALAMLEQSRPDLVLCDTRLPGMDGFELIQEIRKRPDIADIPLMFLSSDVSVETKVRGLQLGVEDYLTKPIYIKELLARVGIVLQRKRREGIEQLDHGNKRRFSGSLSDMSVVDLLQAVDHNKKSGVLYLKSAAAEGAIYFCNGAPVDAALGHLHGSRAIYRTLLWTEGTFEIDFREVDREDHVQTGMQAMLMEGLRRVDEWGRLLEQLPDMDTIFEISETQLFSRLGEIPDQINSVLREVDGERSLWQILDACDGDDLDTLNALSKLYFEGLLYNTGRHANDPKPRAREHEPEPSEMALPHISSGPPVITHTLAPAWPSVPSGEGDQTWTRLDDDTFQLNIPSAPRVPDESHGSPSQAPRRRKGRKRKRRGASQSLVADAAAKRAARATDDAEVHEVDESAVEITPSTIAPPAEEAAAASGKPVKVASVPPPLPTTSRPSKPASWPAEPTTSEVSLAELTEASDSSALRGPDAEVLSEDATTSRDITAAPAPLFGYTTPPPLPGTATRPPLVDAADFTIVPGAPGSSRVNVETARPVGVRTVPPLSAASSAPPGPTTLLPESTGYRDTAQGLQPPAAEGELAVSRPPPLRESLAANAPLANASPTLPPLEASVGDSPENASWTAPPREAEGSFADATANSSPTSPPLDAESEPDLSLADAPSNAASTAPPLDAEAAPDLSFADSPAIASRTQPPLDAEAAPDLSFADSPAIASQTQPPLDAEAAPDLSFADSPAIASQTQPPLDAEAAPDLSFADSPAIASQTQPPLDAEAAPDLSFADSPAIASQTQPPLDAEAAPDLSFADSPMMASDREGTRESLRLAMATNPPLDAEAAPDLSLSDSPPVASLSDSPAAERRGSASPPPLPVDRGTLIGVAKPLWSDKPASRDIAAASQSPASEAPEGSAKTRMSLAPDSARPPDFDAAAAKLAGAKKPRAGAESVTPLGSIKPSLRHQGPLPRATNQPAVTAKPPPFAEVPSLSQSPSLRAEHTPQHRTSVPPAFGIESANDNASQAPALASESNPPPSTEPRESSELSAFAKVALAFNSTRPESAPANDTQPPLDNAAAATVATSDLLSAALSATSESTASATEPAAPIEPTAEQQPASAPPPTAASVRARETLGQMLNEELAADGLEPSLASKTLSQGVWSGPSKAPSTAAPAAKRRSTRWMQVGSVAAATALAAGLYALRARDAAPQGSLIKAVPSREVAPEKELAAPPKPAPQTTPTEPAPQTPAQPAAQASPDVRPEPAPAPAPAPEPAPAPAPAESDKPSPEVAKAPEPEAVDKPTPPPPSAATENATPAPAPAADAKQVLAKGRGLEQKGKKKDALALYEKTVAEGGGSSELLSHMAFLYLNQGNNAQAEANALKATQADETNSEAWIVLGAARSQLGKKLAADEAYRSCASKGQGQYVTECRRMLR